RDGLPDCRNSSIKKQVKRYNIFCLLVPQSPLLARASVRVFSVTPLSRTEVHRAKGPEEAVLYSASSTMLALSTEKAPKYPKASLLKLVIGFDGAIPPPSITSTRVV